MKKTVVIGVTSGIAAYKILELVKLLKKEKLEVYVVMTDNAAHIIKPSEFGKVSGNKVFINLFDKNFDYKKVLASHEVDHIKVADICDVLVIAPATANTIAKLAYGIADNFLLTTALAVTSPVIVCPSMNINMWQNPVVQENIGKLKKRGYQIIEPGVGRLACGYNGKGRLPEIEVIKEEILRQINRTHSLSGKKILITGGGTQEKIDEVRFITNRSHGKMAVALAEECYLRGAEVFLLRAKTSVNPRFPIKEEIFLSAGELYDLIKKHIKNYDIIFHVAAVSDFKPEKSYSGKIKSSQGLTIKLVPQIKISDQIKKLNPKITLVVFKAEYGLSEKEMINRAYEKLKESKTDVVIANDIKAKDRGFEADTNEVFMVFPDRSVKKIPLSSKREIAKGIINYVDKTLREKK